MNALEAWLLPYLLNSLWQVPLVFAAAWLAARAVRRIALAIEHRVWVAALFLEVLLPACSITPGEIARSISQLIPHIDRTGSSSAHVTVAMGAGHAHNLLHIPSGLSATTILLYLCTISCFALRFLWALQKTSRLHRNARPIVPIGGAALTWTRCSNLFSVHNAQAASSSDIRLPMTLGLRRPTLLLPADLPNTLLAEDLNAAIAHEFAHMRRRDFAKNLAYTFLSLPIAFHPFLWITRTYLEETREMVCDEMAANALSGSKSYARSLLRLAALLAPTARDTSIYAIGIFNTSIFERRIMILTQHRIPSRTSTRIIAATACVLLALAASVSALAFRIPIQQIADASNPAPLRTPPRVIFTKAPEYPASELAKKNKFSGDVVVGLVVDKNGLPTDVVIKKSLRPDFDQKAIEAVKQYRFKPATADGKPVDCRLFIDVNFQVF